jgi:hypothetical protein
MIVYFKFHTASDLNTGFSAGGNISIFVTASPPSTEGKFFDFLLLTFDFLTYAMPLLFAWYSLPQWRFAPSSHITNGLLPP